MPVRTKEFLDDDVVAAIEHLRHERVLVLGEALNELARAGSRGTRRPVEFRQEIPDLGSRVDLTNIGDVLDAPHADADLRGRCAELNYARRSNASS